MSVLTITRWNVETSHLVASHGEAIPDYIETTTLDQLRTCLQHLANGKEVRDDRPPLGELTYRYEHDKFDRVTVVHAYFINKHNKLARFMRLRRWNPQ